MARFKGTAGNPHDGASRVGILLVNHGSPDATGAELVAAAKAANAHEFILDLPNAYDTEVGQSGGDFSTASEHTSFARVQPGVEVKPERGVESDEPAE